MTSTTRNSSQAWWRSYPAYTLPDKANDKPSIDYSAVLRDLGDAPAVQLDEKPVVLLAVGDKRHVSDGRYLPRQLMPTE